jgi:hypothetical protein
MPTDNSWIFEGDAAAVRSGTRGEHIEFVTVERLTQTLVVLIDGRKYSRRDLHEWGTHSTTRIANPHDPDVVEAFARQQLRAFVAAGERLIHGASATVHTMTPEQVRAAFDDLADQLNAARKEVDRRAGL